MKTVIFDFDGTLAMTLRVTAEIFNELAPKFDLPQITPENAHLFREKSIKELLKMYPLSPINLIKLTTGIKNRLKDRMQDVQTAEGLKPVLEQLDERGIQLGVVTTNSSQNVERFLAKHQLEMFNFIYAEKNLFGKDKALKNCVKKYKLQPEETWYVGDEVRDVEAAKGAGLKVICVTWGMNNENRLSQAHPDFIIHEPADLLPIVL